MLDNITPQPVAVEEIQTSRDRRPQPRKIALTGADQKALIDAARAASTKENAHWNALWFLGDEVLRVCGPPGAPGLNNNSNQKLRAVGECLKAAGISRYGDDYLKMLRDTADKFPPSKRLEGVPPSCHTYAGDPATLAAAKALADRQRVRLTVAFVKAYRRQLTAKRAEEARRGQLGMHPELSAPRPDPGRENAWLSFVDGVSEIEKIEKQLKGLVAPYVDSNAVRTPTELEARSTYLFYKLFEIDEDEFFAEEVG